MNQIKLIKLSNEYKKQLFDMLDEWISYQSDDPDDKTPYAIFKNDYHNFEYYLNSLEVKENTDNLVTDSVFFALDIKRNIFVGAINIRHHLNDYLFNYGGHIGSGIRPSERNKGYGTELIRLTLLECNKLKINDVLIVCEENNIASRKTIVKNGGVLENKVRYKDGSILERYWIRTNY